jgi:hypothetical protein
MGSSSIKKTSGPSKSSSFKSTPSSSGKSFFSKRSESSSSFLKHEKPPGNDDQQKDRFVKPPHDPGPKIRGDQSEVPGNYQQSGSGNYQVEEDGGGVQETVQRTGRGCCGSITSIITLSIIAVVVIIVVLIAKCG